MLLISKLQLLQPIASVRVYCFIIIQTSLFIVKAQINFS